MSTPKIVIVTGGTRGIGRAIVTTLLEEGYSVLATGKKKGARFLQLDLSNTSSVIELAMHIVRTCGEGSIYGLVNNAGVCETCSVDSQSPDAYMESWKRIMAVNLTGTAHLTHELLSSRVFRPEARIVNIASQLGKVGRAEYSAYCASKFGLIGFTEALSREVAAGGMTVNAVCPGDVETEMLAADLARRADEAGMSALEYRAKLLLKLDLRRFTQPREVADLVSFLLSDKAQGITGQAFSLNGPAM